MTRKVTASSPVATPLSDYFHLLKHIQRIKYNSSKYISVHIRRILLFPGERKILSDIEEVKIVLSKGRGGRPDPEWESEEAEPAPRRIEGA